MVKENPCWDTSNKWMKKKNGKMVPNCVPKEEVVPGSTSIIKRLSAPNHINVEKKLYGITIDKKEIDDKVASKHFW